MSYFNATDAHIRAARLLDALIPISGNNIRCLRCANIYRQRANTAHLNWAEKLKQKGIYRPGGLTDVKAVPFPQLHDLSDAHTGELSKVTRVFMEQIAQMVEDRKPLDEEMADA